MITLLTIGIVGFGSLALAQISRVGWALAGDPGLRPRVRRQGLWSGLGGLVGLGALALLL